ncbi:MAG: hypothetical protein Q9217_004833 [Psora testacea]
MTTAFPPHVQHSSTRIPPSTALGLLSTYLSNAATDASLHPNALLTEDGPITPSTGNNTGLVLHNLKRLEAGLRGEHLAADLTFKKFGGEGLPGLLNPDVVPGRGNRDTRQGGGEELGMDWQDLEDFEREQELVQGEVGARSNAVADEGVMEGEERRAQVQWEESSPVGKDMRKKAKKERQAQRRREKEAIKQRERDAER